MNKPAAVLPQVKSIVNVRLWSTWATRVKSLIQTMLMQVSFTQKTI